MVRKQYIFSSKRTGRLGNITKQKEKFPKLVRDIVRISDIILEVLDARFVEETRNFEIEKEIEKQGKKIIYVLNKADLVKNRGDVSVFPHVYVSSKKRQGIARLRVRIKMEIKKLDSDFHKAHVGIIGYPNTGKSSLINALSGKSSAKIGSQAGFTKGMQKIRLSKDILLLDTPGVIPDIEYSHSKKDKILKQARVGARTIDTIRDPEIVVAGLMGTNSAEIERYYKVDVDGDVDALIEEVGKIKNFLKKGGKVDEDRTAKLIIGDWQEGRIKI